MTRIDSPSPRQDPPVVRQSRLNFFSRMGVGVSALVVIILVGVLITHSTSWTATEMRVLEAMSRSHTAFLNVFALSINFLFGPVIAAALVVATSLLIFGVTRRAGTALQFAVVVAGSWLGSEVIKTIVSRPRPDHLVLEHSLIIEHSASYPSGHTAFAASLAVGLIVLARARPWRGWVIAAGALAVMLVAYSRVYLGVHYVSDVAASIVYSTIAVSMLTAAWNRYVSPRFATNTAARRSERAGM